MTLWKGVVVARFEAKPVSGVAVSSGGGGGGFWFLLWGRGTDILCRKSDKVKNLCSVYHGRQRAYYKTPRLDFTHT